jgi:predicted RNA-binding protein with PUA-like domain
VLHLFSCLLQVDFQLVRKLARQITLEELKGYKEGSLAGMALFNRPRLSVQLVTEQEWQFVLGLEGQQQPAAAATEENGKRRKGKKSSQQE